MEDTAELIQMIPLFSRLDREKLRIIAENCETCRFSAGDSIFKEGSAVREVFYIISGSVRICRHREDGSLMDLAQYIAGESFGEFDLLGSDSRNASAIAEEDMQVIIFPRRGLLFTDLINAHPALFSEVLKQALISISDRIRSTNKLISVKSRWLNELKRQIYQDKLTGVYNRSFLEDEFGEFQKKHKKLALILIKPDNFKWINDNFGHDTGDTVLQDIAAVLSGHAPEHAEIIRYRGNEFGILLPGRDCRTAVDCAKGLSATFKELDISSRTGGVPFHFSVSIGVSCTPEEGHTVHHIVESAHQRMMDVWKQGGDRVSCKRM
jgi:diguanylate cyclase (GGDEF)-like protein